MGTLKLATLGVSDALTAALSGDAEEFSKAIEGLSPAAQKAVTAVRTLSPELKALQQSVQQSFFKQFSGDVTAAVKNLLPLGKGLDGIAAEFGKATSEGLKFLASQQATASLTAILKGTQAAASGLSTAVAPLAKGFLDVAAAVQEAFGAKLGTALGQAGAQFGTYLSTLASSGRAVEIVSKAVEVFKQLGTIASNVGGILSGLFDAAQASGGGLLNNLIALTGAFEKFVNSAQGQEAIGNLFSAVATIAAQLGPILSAIVTQIGAIAPALEPIFTALGRPSSTSSTPSVRPSRRSRPPCRPLRPPSAPRSTRSGPPSARSVRRSRMS
jgi:phage-related protein